MKQPVISVVVPVYQSRQSLKELASRLVKSLEQTDSSFEVILVDDGSPDGCWIEICEIAKFDSRFIGLRLSRNFGQHPAIAAGLEQCTGDWIVVMDCDLQDLPEEIPNLYRKALEGFEQVVGVRSNRQDSVLKKMLSRMYLRILSKLVGVRLNTSVGNFGIYSRRVIDVITSMGEQGRTFGLLAVWAGFSRSELEVVHGSRLYGESSYSLRALIRLAFLGIVNHSDKPLRLTLKFGALLSSVSFLYAVLAAFRQIIWSQAPQGWASVAMLIAFSTGVITAAIGILGLYVGHIFSEVKNRPKFVVWESTVNRDGLI
jgi:glycosyltransferase involved in cell wall biosynthesis